MQAASSLATNPIVPSGFWFCAEVYSHIVARMGWYGPMAHALRWQLPGSSSTAAAGSAAQRGRLASELVRRWPPLACILLGDLRSSLQHAPLGADEPAGTAAHQPGSAAADAASRAPGCHPGGDLHSAAGASDTPPGVWTFASELLEALQTSYHRVISEHWALRRVILQALGEFCACLLRRGHDAMPQPSAAAGCTDNVRASAAESVLRLALTVMQEMLSDWGESAAVDADSAPCYREALVDLLDGLDAALARDLAAMAAGGSSTSAFQERCHLKARLLLCGVSAESRTEPADDHNEAASARGRRAGVVRAHSVFSDAVATAALWAALRREYVSVGSLSRVPHAWSEKHLMYYIAQQVVSAAAKHAPVNLASPCKHLLQDSFGGP